MATNLKQWFAHTSTPFIANAPMFGFADINLVTAVTKAGGFGMLVNLFRIRTTTYLYAQS
jgi:nitronate monooxygenase